MRVVTNEGRGSQLWRARVVMVKSMRMQSTCLAASVFHLSGQHTKHQVAVQNFRRHRFVGVLKLICVEEKISKNLFLVYNICFQMEKFISLPR